MNPAGLLTRQIMQELGVTAEEVALELGFKNQTKGAIKIKKFISGPLTDKNFFAKLAEVLPYPPREYSLSVRVAEYMEDLQQENGDLFFKNDFFSRHLVELLRFRPCLLRVTEREVHRYGLGLLLTNPKHALLTDEVFEDSSYEDQKLLISEMIHTDLREHGPRVERWGKITGYEFFREPLLYDAYSSEGELISENNSISKELFLGEEW